MPATSCRGEIQDKLLPGLRWIDIESLTSKTCLLKKYTQAVIYHRHQLNKEPVPSIKLNLKNNTGTIIDLLAIGQVADDLDVCENGDTLVLLKFEVEDCPRHSEKRYQIIADDTGPVSSNILIFSRKNSVPSVAGVAKQSKKEARQKSSYVYKSLNEVKINTKVDVYGVVKFAKLPTKTKGPDYCCVLGVTDPSFKHFEDKLVCNLFSPDPESLPKAEVGNVIRFHRLKIQSYQGQKQGSNGPGFQWVIFDGSLDERKSVDKRKASSSAYTLEQQDRDKVLYLLDWWSKEVSQAQKASLSTTTLSEVKVKEYFNLVCQVTRICDLESKGCKLLRVWDGTKFNGQLRKVEEKEFNESVRESEKLMKASVNLAADIFVFDDHVGPAGLISPEDFILVTNLHAALVADHIELTMHNGGTRFNRGIEILPVDSQKVVILKSALDPLCLQSDSDAFGHGKANLQLPASRDKEDLSVLSLTALVSSDVQRSTLTNAHERQNENDREKCSPKKRKWNETDKSKETIVTGKKSVPDPCPVTNTTRDQDGVQIDVENNCEVSSDTSHSSQSIWFSAYNDSDFESCILQKKVENGGTGTPPKNNPQTECLLSSQEGEDKKVSAVFSERSTHGVYLSLKRKQEGSEKSCIQPTDEGTLRSGEDLHHNIQGFESPLIVGGKLRISDEESGVKETQISSCFRDGSEDSSSRLVGTLDRNVFGTDLEGNIICHGPLSLEEDVEFRCMLKTASTVVDHPYVSRTALEDVLDHQVPNKFKIQVQVSEFCPRPSSPEDLVYFYCSECHYSEPSNVLNNLKSSSFDGRVCPNCTDIQSPLRPVVVVRFLLTDGKHQLLANLFDEHAIQFFNGIDPVQLLSNEESFQEVQKSLGNLCPVNSSLEDRPLLECCIFSCIVEGEVKYHIFDTVLAQYL